MKKENIYIASCSFGKDSIATILLALENNEPLHKVVFSEVMFDNKNNISGELQEIENRLKQDEKQLKLEFI